MLYWSYSIHLHTRAAKWYLYWSVSLPHSSPFSPTFGDMQDTYELEVVNDKGESVVSQIDPVWDGNKPSTAQFTLHFVTNVLGIGLATYFVRPSRVATLSSVLEYSSTSASRGNVVGEWHYEIEPLDGTNAIVVENRMYPLPSSLSSHIPYPLLNHYSTSMCAWMDAI